MSAKPSVELKFPLPHGHSSLKTQLRIIKAYVVASEMGKEYTGSKELESYGKIDYRTVSSCNNFFQHIGILEASEKSGKYLPTQKAIEVCNNLKRKNKELVKSTLRDCLSTSWFWKYTKQLLDVDESIAKDELIKKLGLLSGVDPQKYAHSLARLVEYMNFVEFTKEDKGKIQALIQESRFPSELKLHPKVVSVSEKLFQDRHYSQAIFEAVKVLEKEIKTKSKIRNKIGVELVNKAFNKDHLIIKIVEGEEQEQIDEREGFRFLYMGTFLGIKNPKSHDIPNLSDPAQALEYLSFISLLMKRLDESTVNN